MALYVIRPDNPPPGEDWQAAVPGQYLYNVTGVYAALNTDALSATTIEDASGNGNNGTYIQDVPPFGPVFIPGLVDGNDAVDAQRLPSTGSVFIEGPSVVGWDASWTLVWWEQTPVLVGSSTFYKYLSAMSPAAPDIIIFQQTGTGLDYIEVTGTTPWRTAPGTIPNDGAPRMLAVMFDHNTGLLSLYLNGTLVPWLVTGSAPATSTPPTGTFQLGNGGLFSANVLDELSIYRTSFLPAFFAALYADQADFTAYNLVALSGGPELYYHFAPNTPATGRQVTLSITDSNNEVERVPSGFDALATPGPYAWSWLPALNSAAENATAKTITVPLPKLLLPAGYTIGTKTLDITPTDQWSDIAIWWNSDVMDASQEINPYAYPPGATLVYRQVQGSS